MFGEAKAFAGIITAAHILGDSIELIRTDCFMRLDKMGHKQTKRRCRAWIFFTISQQRRIILLLSGDEKSRRIFLRSLSETQKKMTEARAFRKGLSLSSVSLLSPKTGFLNLFLIRGTLLGYKIICRYPLLYFTSKYASSSEFGGTPRAFVCTQGWRGTPVKNHCPKTSPDMNHQKIEKKKEDVDIIPKYIKRPNMTKKSKKVYIKFSQNRL